MSKIWQGILAVAIAALIWATDTLVRYPASLKVDPRVIVFFEHLLGFLFFAPYMLLRRRKSLFKMSKPEWVSVFIIGIVGSSFGNLFCSLGVDYAGPTL